MTRVTLRKASRELRRLVPQPWDLGTFIERVGVHRLRPVHLLDFDFSAIGGISGAWKPTPRRDILLVASNATGLRRVAVVCHEISHMWLQHTPDDLGFTGDEAMDALHHELQEASPELARKFVLYRHGYESSAEADAEYLATTVIAAIGKSLPQDQAERIARSLHW